ncbi:MAG: hypothetical protein IPJ68_02515 [Candidatus Moraniibacteriota bacterium]|nr:MAG: hypothetical protein IPJ68_02515 [Candidatus Moranbacteria bacterium]
MPETHYIEIDEEIISAVSRLRKSGDRENIFVLPKRALILQSIINLKLLGREAEKLGKTVIIMTQDEQGMRLAEKAGLRVQEYQDAALRQHRSEASARFTVRHGESIPMPEPAETREGLRRSSEIGSANFYGAATQIATAPPRRAEPSVNTLPERPIVSEPRRQALRVRNASPPVLTALNSLQQTVKRPVTPTVEPKPSPVAIPTDQDRVERAESEKKERLRRLFEGRVAGVSTVMTPPRQMVSATPTSSVARPTESKGVRKLWLTVIGGAVLIGAVFAGYFFLRPEAIIAVEPQTATQTVKLSLFGTIDGGSSAIPVRYVEEEKTVRLAREATGQDTGAGAKAGGTITITNTFSEVSQSLVATTRFELPDGRLYRLVGGVTVPGTKSEDGKTVPGKIEARVVADSAGTKYNISSGTFSIPGFKGSPKFEKITAEVKGAFTGGSDGVATAARSVSETDLESAKAAAAEQAKQTVFEGVASTLKSGESVLEPSFQTSLIGTPTAPATGSAAGEAFDYEARFQVKGFIIMESAVKNIIDRETTESGGVVLRPYQYDVNYGTVLPNFESKRVDLTVESKVLFRAPLEAATIKQGLLGLNESGIRTYLADHPEIKRLQVEFKPKVFIATIPDDAERVVVHLMEADNE